MAVVFDEKDMHATPKHRATSKNKNSTTFTTATAPTIVGTNIYVSHEEELTIHPDRWRDERDEADDVEDIKTKSA